MKSILTINENFR